MEENKKTNILVLSTLTVLSIIAIIIMITIIFIQKNNYKQKIAALESNIEELELKNNKKINNTYKDNLKTSYQSAMGEYDRIAIYLESDNRKNALPGITRAFVDNKGDAYIYIDKENELLSKYEEKYKVDSNVTNIYLCYIGNGGYADLVFLHNDGTVSKISGISVADGKIATESINQLKNIVNVIAVNKGDEYGSGGSTYYFIDIEGNILKEY